MFILTEKGKENTEPQLNSNLFSSYINIIDVSYDFIHFIENQLKHIFHNKMTLFGYGNRKDTFFWFCSLQLCCQILK